MTSPRWWSPVLTWLTLAALGSASPPRPHIVYIIADDLGWNDVGFHGSNQIPTPNIDALAYDGLILNNYYVTAICTPSRSALMTGRHPIHTGMQHGVLKGAESRGLPLNQTLLPQYLKELGYRTHIVGKWHLGMYTEDYTPTRRGFDSHLGYWTGHQDYFDHTAVELPYWGLDMRRGMDPAWDLHGQYSTDIFTEEAVSLIQSHNTSEPMFLYLAHAAVHSGNPYNPLPVHDSDVMKVTNVEDYNRRKFAAMVTKLDESVGRVVKALTKAQMLQDSIVVFTTDNGGPAAGFNLNAASNWPLKGVKNTLWEGGVRGVGLIWSPLINTPRRVATQLMHISDWLPTLYRAVGGDPRDLGDIDGIDCWVALSEDEESNRTQVLHNIDDIERIGAITVGDWKMVTGSTYQGTWDGWYGPSGRDTQLTYNLETVFDSSAARALETLRPAPPVQLIRQLRDSATVDCGTPPPGESLKEATECHSLEAPCLFNVKKDPCELYNLADSHPQILHQLEAILQQWNATAVLPSNTPMDPKADPNNWDHTWTNFGDYGYYKNYVN